MAQRSARLPATVVIGLVLAVVLDTFTHITWKLAVAGVPAEASSVVAAGVILRTPLFYAAIAGFVAQFWNWLRVLAHADLSFAQPITALSLVTVLIMSRIVLHEQLTWTRLGGVALIMAGVYCISQTPVRTAARVDEPAVR